MALGDATNAVTLSNGRGFTVDFEGLDDTLITGFEAGKVVTLAGTSEGYDSTGTLGTIARSGIRAAFRSVADYGPGVGARVTFDWLEPFCNDCTGITVDLPAGLFDDGTNQSNAASGLAVSNVGNLLDYPTMQVGLCGVIDAAGEIGVNYSAVSGTVSVECLAFQAPYPSTLSGEPAAAVKLEVAEELVLDGTGIVGIGGVADGEAVTGAGYSAIVVGTYAAGDQNITVREVAGTPTGGLSFSGGSTGTWQSGGSSLSSMVTAMSRSRYNPSRYYGASQTAGFISEDPYAANGGGSFVFKSDFDLSTLDDGNINIYQTAWPTLGDAQSVRDITTVPESRRVHWQCYNDSASTLTTETTYVDSRGTIPCSGLSFKNPTRGELVTGATSGATAIYNGKSGNTMLANYLSGTFNASESLVFEASGTTGVSTAGTPSWNGDDTAAGTTGAPFRTLPQAIVAAQSGSTGVRYRFVLKGDGGSRTDYYAHGRAIFTSNDLSTWAEVVGDTGLTASHLVVLGRGSGTSTDSRCKRLRFIGVTCWIGRLGTTTGTSAFQGDNNRNTALWLDRCALTHGAGRANTSVGGWMLTEYGDAGGGGLYGTGTQTTEWIASGFAQYDLARDCDADTVDADMIQTNSLLMEVFGRDNDSQDPLAHEDCIQVQSTADLCAVAYNIVCPEIITRQLFLADDVRGFALVNFVGIAVTTDADPSLSQIGNSGTLHNISNLFFAHVVLVNSDIRTRVGASGDVDDHIASTYSVFLDLDVGLGNSDKVRASHCHLLDAATVDYPTITGDAAATNPWANGVRADQGDDIAKRDYSPASSKLQSRVSTGQRYIPGDIFGYIIANDGTGSIGAVQVALSAPAARSSGNMSISISVGLNM